VPEEPGVVTVREIGAVVPPPALLPEQGRARHGTSHVGQVPELGRGAIRGSAHEVLSYAIEELDRRPKAGPVSDESHLAPGSLPKP
jgi:hypothetical protein